MARQQKTPLAAPTPLPNLTRRQLADITRWYESILRNLGLLDEPPASVAPAVVARISNDKQKALDTFLQSFQ
ncbi:hypothetical protein [Deinococcus peraridilitoris]|uniref:Uncharacterized protein n=1 Tax=Deinococcus peraridilitoris (strain DSM 19664 / LMG 22246 / CIP 109416 / KR-200) TaxID=937777 RepID=L0A141_DEIPD|nr:hypothetical protein [Deinococcus peraridilitoris]AFZ67561.1 hypothetical protein Deipe_2065 [Deinococcus peraridilitoris DSM 19664]